MTNEELDVIDYNNEYYEILEEEIGGNPLPLIPVMGMTQAFDMYYKLSFVGSQGNVIIPNTDIKNYGTLKIKASIIKTFLAIDPNYAANQGAQFIYILDTDDTGTKYFTYAISPASYDSVQKKVITKPKADGSFEYLVPTYNGHKIINQTEFLALKAQYYDIVDIREPNFNVTYPINVFQSIIHQEHPNNCFYLDSILYEFFKDNETVSINDNLFYLKILNGAIYCNSYAPFDFCVQTPILAFEYDGNIIVNTDMVLRNYPYYYRALDVGRLCPPDC